MLRKGNTGEAIGKLEAAGKAASADPAVLKALAQGYAATGKSDSAIAVLQRSEAGAPKDIAVRERLIELLRRTGIGAGGKAAAQSQRIYASCQSRAQTVAGRPGNRAGICGGEEGDVVIRK